MDIGLYRILKSAAVLKLVEKKADDNCHRNLYD